MKSQRVLLLGGSGIVGRAVEAALRERGVNVSVVARSAADSVTQVGDIATPSLELDEYLAAHDVIVNLIACTRWTMTQDEAQQANVETARAAVTRTRKEAAFVHVSTSFLGSRGAGEVGESHTFKNSYEESKALSERAVLEARPDATVIRLPQIVGERETGEILRYNGLYSIAAAMATGLVPAFVGDRDAPIDIAPVNEAGALIADAALGLTDSFEILSAGPAGMTLEQCRDIMLGTLSSARQERGAEPIPTIPIVPMETWERLHWPIAQSTLRKLELKAISLIMEFSRYTGGFHGAVPTRLVRDSGELWASCLERWILDNERRMHRPLRQWVVR